MKPININTFNAYIMTCRGFMIVDAQLLLGVSIGLIIFGFLGLVIVFIFKFLQRNQTQNETQNELPPVYVLEVGDNGLWYIKAMSAKSIDMQIVDSDQVEAIIGDFISAQITDYRPYYNLDIICSNGNEYSVIMEKKTAIEEEVETHW